MYLHIVEFHNVERPVAGDVAAAVSHARFLLLTVFLLQLLHLVAHLLVELVIDIGTHHAVMFQERCYLFLRQFLLHLHHADVGSGDFSLVEQYIFRHGDAEMLMLHEGRHDRSETSQTCCERYGAAVGYLLQVDVLLQLTCNGILQGIDACLQGFCIRQHLFQQVFLECHAISQHHCLRQIQRCRNILRLLRRHIQSKNKGKQYGS